MVYCCNAAFLFIGFKVLEWCDGTREHERLLDDGNGKEPWNNDEDNGDIHFFFSRVAGERSGFEVIVLSRDDKVDVYLASTTCLFEARDWKPVSIPRAIDPVALVAGTRARFEEVSAMIGITPRKPGLVLVSEGYPST